MHIQTISILIFYHIITIKFRSLILEQAKVNDHLNWVNTSKLLSFLYVYFRCCRSNRNIFMGYFFHLLLLFYHCYISLSSQILQQQFSQSIWQQPIMWRIIHDTRQYLVFHHSGKLIMINVIRSQKEKMGRKHHDITKWRHFPRHWPFVWGIHWWPVNSPHKDQWCGALIFFFDLCLNKWLSKQWRGWWFDVMTSL